jgi:uncharacterized protein
VSGFLLDVNVLIALIDPAHIHHDAAHEWFAAIGNSAWATCPITENAVVRIVGDPRYPNSPGTPAAVTDILERFFTAPGHTFWEDEISLLDPQHVDTTRLLSSRQVTDTYLLALAHSHQGKLATFDRRLISLAVRDAAQHLHVIQ